MSNDCKNTLPHLQLWGGLECTINRIHDCYVDQCARNGHDRRLEDVERFSSLGFDVLRYPVLWEKVAPDNIEQLQWDVVESRLNRLHELGIDVIAGLLHHGSGPRYTSLTDRDFPRQLAQYARAVAARFPWIKHFTPVNEPLTTARFSGLYGFWYPHARSSKVFIEALLNQCRGILLAMESIRSVTPDACLIQTEDLGRITSTQKLRYQADFENQRRWLSLDLLCGRVTKSHPFWSYFLSHGVRPDDLMWFRKHACPPDIIGINHYLTSNRHLDQAMQRYPLWSVGGNGRHRYCDVDAVRVFGIDYARPLSLFREAWRRYYLPLAVTEVHLDSTREQQMRWLYEVWQEALAGRSEGIDIRAITAWSLLGSFDWNCQVTREDGYYESGVFSICSGQPRPTALARMITELHETGHATHPVLDQQGWWHGPKRFWYRSSDPDPAFENTEVTRPAAFGQPILITGCQGVLGSAFVRICRDRDLHFVALNRNNLDITDSGAIVKIIQALKPWAVINAAGYSRVDSAEFESELCRRENVTGAVTLASICSHENIPLMTFSSHMVFGGQGEQPYIESSPVGPLNVYGKSKVEAEEKVLESYPAALIIRSSPFFGPWDSSNFLTRALQSIRKGKPLIVPEKIRISLTYIPDLVNTALNLLLDRESGLWHLANPGVLTWQDVFTLALQEAHLNRQLIIVRPIEEVGYRAPRPVYSALASRYGTLLPPFETALAQYMDSSGDSA